MNKNEKVCFLSWTSQNFNHDHCNLSNVHFHKIGAFKVIYEACIGVIGIQDICHFTSRDIGYYPFYFQGYRILCSISGILCFLPKNKKK